MTIFCDIDNTICKTEGNDYKNAVPIQENIDKINKFYDKGDFIIYWTARGTTSGKDWRTITENQLIEWGCRYNSLRMKKPSYDMFIDDKSKRIEEL